jgi:hypothetical protein
MNRSSFAGFTTRKPAVFAATIAAAGLALAACGGSSGYGAATTSSSAATGKAAASASSNSGTSGNGTVAGSALFPLAVGNTWVYDVTLSAGKGTATDRITAVTPISGGQQATMTHSADFPGLTSVSKTTTETVIFHSDGSISIPMTEAGSTAVTIKSGSIIWPSAADLASGQSRTNKLVMTAAAAGQSATITADVVAKGAGSATVTVPAGTYQTTIIDQTITAHFDGITIDMRIQTWDASGVGPVKSEVNSTIGGKTTTVSVEELKSFTKG